MPTLSVIVAYHSHHGSALAADIGLAAFFVVTALVHPIYWSLFFVVGVIGLVRPTNVEDGLRWWIVVWKFTSSGLPFFFSYFWLIVGWCIVLILHCSPGVLSGLSVHLPFCFSASRLRHESWGGVGSST